MRKFPLHDVCSCVLSERVRSKLSFCLASMVVGDAKQGDWVIWNHCCGHVLPNSISISKDCGSLRGANSLSKWLVGAYGASAARRWKRIPLEYAQALIDFSQPCKIVFISAQLSLER